MSPALQHWDRCGVFPLYPPWWLQPPSTSSLSPSALLLPPGRLHGFGGTISVCFNPWSPWGLTLRVLEDPHLPSSRGMTLVCPARHHLSTAQALCSRHTDSHSPQVPSKENWSGFTKHLMLAYTKQQKNGHFQKNDFYKKRWDFAIHFRNSHYQVVPILPSLQKHRNSHLPLSLPVSAGSLGCFHVHPHLSFLTWYYRNISVCSFHMLRSKAFLSTGSCIPTISSCV